MDHSDAFANFSPQPSRNMPTRYRYFTRRNRYQAMASLSASREQLFGSNTSLSAFGSSQDLSLDSGRLMDLQEDAKSRLISAQVMKHRLYESVVQSPRRRRFSMRMDYFGHGMPIADEGVHPSRYVQSLPVTPAHSSNVSPVHSPTSQRRFPFGYFSRGTTPDEERKPIGEEGDGADGYQGLAGILKPYPATPENEEGPSEMETQCSAAARREETENRLMPPPLIPGLTKRYQGVITRDMLRYPRLYHKPTPMPAPPAANDSRVEDIDMDTGDP